MAAHKMPPAALATKKCDQRILLVPAKKAAYVRRIETKRPKKTTFRPGGRTRTARLSTSPHRYAPLAHSGGLTGNRLCPL